MYKNDQLSTLTSMFVTNIVLAQDRRHQQIKYSIKGASEGFLWSEAAPIGSGSSGISNCQLCIVPLLVLLIFF